MAHAQKPHFVFRLNGPVHLNRRGESVQSTAGSQGVRISVSNAGYTMFRGRVRVLATHSIRQFPFHFPSRASPCAITFRTQYTKYFAAYRVVIPYRRFGTNYRSCRPHDVHRGGTLKSGMCSLTWPDHLHTVPLTLQFSWMEHAGIQ